jgi:hypothetical protein
MTALRRLAGRFRDAARAFRDCPTDTWCVIEDFYPVGFRIVARFNDYESAASWLDGNRRGVMRVWTLDTYRRRIVAEMESDQVWLDLARRTTHAWRSREEERIADLEAFAATAKRDPFKDTGSHRIVGTE